MRRDSALLQSANAGSGFYGVQTTRRTRMAAFHRQETGSRALRQIPDAGTCAAVWRASHDPSRHERQEPASVAHGPRAVVKAI